MNAINNARQDVERGKVTLFDAASCAEVEEPWRFPVGPRDIAGSVRDCVKFRGKVFSCASSYAPNSIFQCLLKSIVVPVMSFCREIVLGMPLFIGSILSPKTEFSTMRETILFGGWV